MKLGDIKPMTGFELKPVGWYHVGITNVERKKSPKGNTFVFTEFTILEGEHEGRKLFKNWFITEKSLGFIQPFLMSLTKVYNCDTDLQVENGMAVVDENKWRGQQLMVYNDHEPYTDKDGNEKMKDAPAMYHSLEHEGKQPIGTPGQTSDKEEIPF